MVYGVGGFCCSGFFFFVHKGPCCPIRVSTVPTVAAPVEYQLGLLAASPTGLFTIQLWHQYLLKPHCSWDTLIEVKLL